MHDISKAWLMLVVLFGSACVLIGLSSLTLGLELPWLKHRPDGKRRSLSGGLAGMAMILMSGPELADWNTIARDILGIIGISFPALSLFLVLKTQQRKTH